MVTGSVARKPMERLGDSAIEHVQSGQHFDLSSGRRILDIDRYPLGFFLLFFDVRDFPQRLEMGDPVAQRPDGLKAGVDGAYVRLVVPVTSVTRVAMVRKDRRDDRVPRQVEIQQWCPEAERHIRNHLIGADRVEFWGVGVSLLSLVPVPVVSDGLHLLPAFAAQSQYFVPIVGISAADDSGRMLGHRILAKSEVEAISQRYFDDAC